MNCASPSRLRLLSGRASTKILSEADCCEPIQARHVLACGLAGIGYDYGSSVIYEEHEIIDLANRPKLSLDDFWSRVDQDVAIVVRQHARSLVAEENRDETRGWYGVDLFAPDEEQRAASSRWWELGSRRKALVEAAMDKSPIPFLVSVGGYIARTYEATAIEYELSALSPRGKFAFTLKEGFPSWEDAVKDHWMRTPRGTALIVLERP